MVKMMLSASLHNWRTVMLHRCRFIKYKVNRILEESYQENTYSNRKYDLGKVVKHEQ